MRARLFAILAACLCLVAGLVSAAGAAEPGWGDAYAVTGSIPLFDSRSDTARKVRTLKAGQRVRVDFRDAQWAAVFDAREAERSEQKALGFARLDVLSLHAALDPSFPSPLPRPIAPPPPTPIPAAEAQKEPRKERAKPAPEKSKVLAAAEAAPVSEKHHDGAKPADRQPDKAPEKAPAKAVEKSAGKQAEKSSEKAEAKHPAKPAEKPAEKPTEKAAAKPVEKPPRDAAHTAKAKGSSFGELRVADRNLAVRSARSAESEFRRLLRAGQPVRVDFLEDGWYAVFDPEEKTRDLGRAWGYSRDKYLVPEAAYAGPPPEAQPASQAGERKRGEDGQQVSYTVLGRTGQAGRQGVVTLRVRLDLAQPPAAETLRKVAREVWKSERRKDENLQLELYLNGMDPGGLAYATARFHEDGRLFEFWWREVLLKQPRK